MRPAAALTKSRMLEACRRFGPLLALGMILSACNVFSPYVPPPLEGERISVLSLEQTLEPDPGIQDLQVRLPRPFANAAWPQTGGSASKAMHHLAVGEAPRRQWRVNVGAGSSRDRRLTASPVVSDGRIIVLDANGLVVAHDMQTGKRLWRYDVVPKGEWRGALGGGLAVAGETLFVTSGYGDVVAIATASGGEIWRTPLNVPLASPPTVAGDLLFVVTNDNQTFGLRAEDG